jgi:hypothetical protein
MELNQGFLFLEGREFEPIEPIRNINGEKSYSRRLQRV